MIFFMKWGSPARSTYRLPCSAQALFAQTKFQTCPNAQQRTTYAPDDVRPPQPVRAHDVDDNLRVLHRGLHILVPIDVNLHDLHAVIYPKRLLQLFSLCLRANSNRERERRALGVVVEVACYEASRETCAKRTSEGMICEKLRVG